MRELDAKKHCHCGNDPIHGHCLTCNSPIVEGKSTCSACEERKRRHRYCSRCHEEFYLEAVEVEVTTPHRFGLCGEECYKPYLDNLLKSSSVPPRFIACTLGGFKGYTKGLAEKLRLVRRWLDGDLATGLYLFGGVGTGKTHLAVGVLRALTERRGFCGTFASARSFVMRCQTAFRNRESAEDIVNELLRGMRLLILDDLGSEKVTDYARQSLLHLVGECYDRGVTLIITSNVGLEELNKIDERIASRIAEMCDRLRLEEPDYRVAIAKNRARGDAPRTQAPIRSLVQ
jgi:DNA replication protein DnaC